MSAAVLTSLLLGLGMAGAALPIAPQLKAMDGRVRPAPSAAAILLFWRADCAPCLLELSDAAALRRAAHPTRLDFVGLQAASALTPRLSKLGLKPSDSLRTDEDAAGLLQRIGGAPPRLPLAAAFRADGSLCATHHGLIGRDQVRAWGRACGAADAAR